MKKWNIDRKYIRMVITILFIVCFAIWFNYMLQHDSKFEEIRTTFTSTMFPIFVGCVIAYIMNPVLGFFERTIASPLGGFLFGVSISGKNSSKDEEETEQKKNKDDEKKDEDDEEESASFSIPFRPKDKAVCRKKALKFSRTLGVVLTEILFFVILIGGIYMVVPQVYMSIKTLTKNAPDYYDSFIKWVNGLSKGNEEINKYVVMVSDKLYDNGLDYINHDVLPNMDKIVVGITTGIMGGLKIVLNIILAMIISIYVLLNKEVLVGVSKKLLYSFFKRERANAIVRGARYADKVFGGFISGKLIDSFIIGIICYIVMIIFKWDYPVLISIIIGVTNIIPFFGPLIGAVPSTLLLLMVKPSEGLFFVIFVLALQQLDGNIIGPIILGDRLKLNSMWILFAILVGGGLFGVPGMILGAPCFACLYALVGTACRATLAKREMPVDAKDYVYLDQMEEK